jgi:hypothetical protein
VPVPQRLPDGTPPQPLSTAPPAAHPPAVVSAQRVQQGEPTVIEIASAHRVPEQPVHHATPIPLPTTTATTTAETPSTQPAVAPLFAVQRAAAPAPPAAPVAGAPVAPPQQQSIPAAPRPVVPALQRDVSPPFPQPSVTPVPRRLVVLPPLRAPEHTDIPATPAPAAVQHIAESSPPIPLQRMFGQAAPAVPRERAAAATVLPRSPSVVAHPGYTEVSFEQHTVQRDAEPADTSSAAEESDPPQASVNAAPAAPVAPQATAGEATPAGGNIDELVNRLYDPLAARLRSELWLDRERAGALMDLRR